MQKFNSPSELAIQKVNSLKVDLANFEEFGIKEQEFSQIFKFEPIYTLSQFGKFLYGDLSEILTLKQHKEVLRDLKTKNPKIREIRCLLRLHEVDLSQGNL